ncbi:MAG: insulinase family protein, partial [Chlamydiia bacterium]|nr:insulinase family protein [Chlamydiia bacterium]
MKLKIKLAQRTIEASTCENGLKTVFKLIHLIFTRTAPNTDGMNRVLASSIDVLKLRDRDPNQVFEDLLLKVNTGDHFLLRPMEQEAVALASTESTKDFFQRCYGNPADFTIVIVGDCDVERVLDLAQRYLANLQATRPSFSEPTRIDLPFPHHALKHRVRESKEWDDVTV